LGKSRKRRRRENAPSEKGPPPSGLQDFPQRRREESRDGGGKSSNVKNKEKTVGEHCAIKRIVRGSSTKHNRGGGEKNVHLPQVKWGQSGGDIGGRGRGPGLKGRQRKPKIELRAK